LLNIDEYIDIASPLPPDLRSALKWHSPKDMLTVLHYFEYNYSIPGGYYVAETYE
jgi:hypothetical protein